ncbi:lactosylceramide 4-alpha-galactosyltransferase-like [Schistocerca cancellata]|uniref:lactosylceramide 4-alpha-galactosyltransferase-like n=1 Tax=Schistocerca cancellata TaxID=274614 RepID=UPI002117D983|nr:lactosylceramide 4-alpha-galactosyltransferase-like [Schistocerca cancellata]XP_049773476.1 lactosylceramide 4-alpha-galactosyltransferase-like [Schistocerca cancellata]
MLLAVPLTSAEVRMPDGRDTYASQGYHLQVPLLERQPMSPTIRCRYTHKTYVIVLVCAAILVTWSVARFPKHKLWPYDRRTVPQRGAANIFFIETTCAIEDVPWSGLRPRQACAVESAVRHNPGRPVYVLHTCEAPILGLSLPAGATAVHVTLEEFLRDTPLYTTLIEYAALANSAWPVHHASDVMRVIALWKYGGLYLDLDFVVLRNLSELGEDWAGAEDNITVANSAMHMSAQPGSAGQEMAEALIETLQTDFDGQQWMYNGGGHLTRLLFIRCNVPSVVAMTNCRGFRVLATELLFPVHYSHWERYFWEEEAEGVLADARNAYAVHVWNKFSGEADIVPQNSAYGMLARQNCPDSFSAAEGSFG